jgi:hypothetical protein
MAAEDFKKRKPGMYEKLLKRSQQLVKKDYKLELERNCIINLLIFLIFQFLSKFMIDNKICILLTKNIGKRILLNDY